MFERRLKLFLILLSCLVLVLIGRAAQVQIVNRGYWVAQAAEAMKRTHLVDTSRGNIYDRNGKLLATDQPCVDACVDYRALTDPPDPEWVRARALDRLRNRYGDAWQKLTVRQKINLRSAEQDAVVNDIHGMWGALANVSSRSVNDIEEARQAIVHRVEMRQRYVWWKRYEEALAKGGKKMENVGGGWKRFVTDDGATDAPPVDSFKVTVSEQLEPHVILRAIDTDTQNELGKHIDLYPGLVLRPGTHRTYPYDDVACHLLGHLSRVSADDIKSNKTAPDELRAYLPNDLIGGAGIESLCEPTLRGTRGKVDRVLGDEKRILARVDPAQGGDVKVTVDIELQQQIQSVFAAATLRGGDGKVLETGAVLHGAAVVLDVATDDVLALVSYPTYDLNRYDELYPSLRNDELNEPMMNRATMAQLEPGSTIKPLCGLAGISAGVIGVNEGIECTGYLYFDKRRIDFGRCWVASKFEKQLLAAGMSVAHHPVPSYAPHVGHDGNPDGFLTYSDALERSCNVFFETVADRLKIDGLSSWYSKFGLGRPTGVGIGEARGRLPSSVPQYAPQRRMLGAYAGIGQGPVAATPIQMANAAAMIARDGIWMRPRLLRAGDDGKTPAVRAGAWPADAPERVDLHLPPEALKAAKLGMFNVVNARAGTGKALVVKDAMLEEMGIAGKTGTAQAARFRVHERDGAGRFVLDQQTHKPAYRFLVPSTEAQPNVEAPWYRAADKEGHDLNHAWYIGFAPADKPRIAFAVMVEYGGSGGIAAASVAREALGACVSRGYLPAKRPPQEQQARIQD